MRFEANFPYRIVLLSSVLSNSRKSHSDNLKHVYNITTDLSGSEVADEWAKCQWYYMCTLNHARELEKWVLN